MATSAMLAGLSYGRVVDQAPNLFRRGWGLSSGELAALLRKLTGARWRPRILSPRAPFLRRHLPPSSAAVFLAQRGQNVGHWIAWDGALVFDPFDDGPVHASRLAYRRSVEIAFLLTRSE